MPSRIHVQNCFAKIQLVLHGVTMQSHCARCLHSNCLSLFCFRNTIQTRVLWSLPPGPRRRRVDGVSVCLWRALRLSHARQVFSESTALELSIPPEVHSSYAITTSSTRIDCQMAHQIDLVERWRITSDGLLTARV